MSGISFVIAAMAPLAKTLDRQHAFAMLLTSATGVIILTLALISRTSAPVAGPTT